MRYGLTQKYIFCYELCLYVILSLLEINELKKSNVVRFGTRVGLLQQLGRVLGNLGIFIENFVYLLVVLVT